MNKFTTIRILKTDKEVLEMIRNKEDNNSQTFHRIINTYLITNVIKYKR